MEPSVLSLAKALSCELRVYILQCVGSGGMCVSEIAEHTGTSTGTVCHHLAVLREQGLVVRERQGRRSIYKWGLTRCGFTIETVADAEPGTAG